MTADRYLAIKAVMMPRDTNPYGTIFGGVILSYLDQAGACGARHEVRTQGWPQRTFVTVGMQSVAFHEPVHVGDLVSFWTRLVRIGRSSITMHVDVEAERDGRVVNVTEAEVTYVAVESDAEGARRPVQIRP